MLSVVIPAYNEEKSISSCLASLAKQKTKKKFEVIVVDNASTDQTVLIAKKFSKKLNLKIVREKNKGRGPARAKGFSVASGDIILSTDADTKLPNNWIEYFSSTLELLCKKTIDKPKKQKIIAVTGTCKVDDLSILNNTVLNICQPITMHIYRLFVGHYWLSGFSFAITKKAYLESGGFCKILNAYEDIDLAVKVNKIGKIHLIKNIPVIFSSRRFKKGLSKGTFQYITNLFNYFVLKNKNPELSDVR